MDKQFKLTDRVSKESLKSPIFKKWVKRILCIACILSVALQLTLCCMPMKASAAESIVGTWVFNDTIDVSSLFQIQYDYTYINGHAYLLNFYGFYNGSTYDNFHALFVSSNGTSLYYRTGENGNNSALAYSSYWRNDKFKTIEILNDDNVNPAVVNWLKANATKVTNDIYDFTGETRIFNDELTLFNTSDATWTYSANFNFEVLGVGSADYLSLQRTSQNWYTMSYAFDFEGSGGLTMIYRDTPPFNDDEANWLGGKLNRKVITFLSNPEDPEFQQWLLDNTTIFDNVNDAYDLGQKSGYNNGYEEGFANSLIGDSLSGPINALSQITLIEIQGTAITLGGVVMTAIALCLVLAFLKLYAGG